MAGGVELTDGPNIVCSTGNGFTISSGLGRSNEGPRAGGPGGGGAVPCGNLSRSRPDSMPPVIGVTGAIGVSPDSDSSDPSDSSVPSDSSEDVVPKQERWKRFLHGNDSERWSTSKGLDVVIG